MSSQPSTPRGGPAANYLTQQLWTETPPPPLNGNARHDYAFACPLNQSLYNPIMQVQMKQQGMEEVCTNGMLHNFSGFTEHILDFIFFFFDSRKRNGFVAPPMHLSLFLPRSSPIKRIW